MTKNLITFRKIPTFQEAKDIVEILKQADINTQLVDDVPVVDVTFTSRTEQNSVIIKIQKSDLEKANKVLTSYDSIAIKNIDQDYYLLEFSDSELYDVLQNSDEWSDFDYLLAQSLLRERGHHIDDTSLRKMREDKITILSQPDILPKYTLIAGYIFSLLGGFLGIMIGYSILSSKKSLPNGNKVSTYSDKDRKQGKNILYIGIVCFVIGLIIKLTLMSNY